LCPDPNQRKNPRSRVVRGNESLQTMVDLVVPTWNPRKREKKAQDRRRDC